MTNELHPAANSEREDYAYKFMAWAHDEFFSTEPVPPYRIGFGQPPGSRPRRNGRILGACFKRSASSDGRNELFFCPTESDTINMLVTFLHEYCHALDDVQSGHTGNFVRLAKLAGLEAPYTETPPSAELREVLEWYQSEYGEIPSGHLKQAARLKPKQSTRMIKVMCRACEFHFRTSTKQIERIDSSDARCPCCNTKGTLVLG